MSAIVEDEIVKGEMVVTGVDIKIMLPSNRMVHNPIAHQLIVEALEQIRDIYEAVDSVAAAWEA